MFKSPFQTETPEEEQARLAGAPEGSTLHFLSSLPVNIKGPLQDLVIELPSKHGRRIVVVPFEPRPSTDEQNLRSEVSRRRHGSWWACIVVASDVESYPVGGHRLSIPECELVRGKRIEV